jgi:hypothetical protein
LSKQAGAPAGLALDIGLETWDFDHKSRIALPPLLTAAQPRELRKTAEAI